ncbi:MAG TPA: TetR/AcrR family transcriptional regulator, partial [Frankiaceae bacterium]|nr:TetR/AcrR family transcriptional regulator [Frankiaceae bacterium]
MPRRTQADRRADTRDRLLRAAAELFASQGYDAVSVDEVAAAADRSSGAVYAHFGSKQGLLRALLDSWKETTATVVQAEFAVATDPASRMAAIWRNVSHPPDDPGDQWLLLEHELWLRAVRDPEVGVGLRNRYAEVRASMAAGFAERGVPQRLVAELAAQVFALLIGLDMQRRLDPAAV